MDFEQGDLARLLCLPCDERTKHVIIDEKHQRCKKCDLVRKTPEVGDTTLLFCLYCDRNTRQTITDERHQTCQVCDTTTRSFTPEELLY